MASSLGPQRIGEFSRRVGVSRELLRAWEQRYGLLSPLRSAGGFRLYTDEDAERVARMRQALEQGLSAAEAARAVLQPGVAADEAALGTESLLDDAGRSLFSAIERFDEDAVQALLDQALARFNLEPVLRHLILPTLARVGDAWQENTVAISQEHFASHLIRGRLLALARLWGRGVGPRALLACAPGEEHDITLIAFGLLLRSHGWRILFLGADTPLTTLAQAALTVQPELVVVSSFDAALLADNAPALKRLTRRTRLALGGPGAPPALCERLGAECLAADLLVASHAIAA